MSIAAIFLTLFFGWAFIAVVEIIMFYLNDTSEDDEFFKNKWKDPYDIDRPSDLTNKKTPYLLS